MTIREEIRAIMRGWKGDFDVGKQLDVANREEGERELRSMRNEIRDLGEEVRVVWCTECLEEFVGKTQRMWQKESKGESGVLGERIEEVKEKIVRESEEGGRRNSILTTSIKNM